MDKKKIEKGVKLILEGIGEDTDRPGILSTPKRIAELYEEIFSGLHTPTEEILVPIEGETHEEMVLLKDIPFYYTIRRENSWFEQTCSGTRSFCKKAYRAGTFKHPTGRPDYEKA
jgi:hypothetical protein